MKKIIKLQIRKLKIRVIKTKNKTAILYEQLTNIWESSVQATHFFFSNDEISNLKRTLPAVLEKAPVLVVAFDENNFPTAFMSITDNMLDMLFVSKERRGNGIGKQLLQYGIDNYLIEKLSVYEQNYLAREFYEHHGFEVYKRSEFDEQGNPYPILYMKIKK